MNPYEEHELPELATRAISLAYVATAICMPMLFLTEAIARIRGFGVDSLEGPAWRCLGPAAIGAAFALLNRRYPIARRRPFVQGYILMSGMGIVLALSAAPTGATHSPYVISLQTMLYLWSLIMPGGARRALPPVLSTTLIFFAVLAATHADEFADTRGKMFVVFSLASSACSVFCAEILERWRRQMSAASSLDSLTQLFNRRYLLERFTALHAEASASKRPVSVLTFDIDHFKVVNDNHGHAVGDRVIRHVAGILAQCTRASDLAGRLGGEEFVLVLDGCEAATAASVAERVRATVEAGTVRVDGETMRVTVSVGVATQPSDLRTTVDDLLRASDEALYASKRAGRNRVSVAENVGSGELDALGMPVGARPA